MKKSIYFVTGIDTDIGKSIATGYVAKEAMARPECGRVLTMKWIQTGTDTCPLDVMTHRRVMGMAPTAEDRLGLTCPIQMRYPASPHLAARLENKTIDWAAYEGAIDALMQTVDTLFIEGAGGLMVPLTDTQLTIDWVAQKGYPLIVVTSARLGSINHTLLTLEAIKHRGLTLHEVVFNEVHNGLDEVIAADTHDYLKRATLVMFPQAKWTVMPVWHDSAP